jgi:uracil-DNA glycosylase family 4
MSDNAELDELRSLTRALRAHLEWQAATGASGLPAHSALAALQQPAPALDSPVVATLRQPHLAAPRESGARLSVLAETVRQCTRCVLCRQRKQTVFARGNGSAGLCFVGEGPGAEEDAQGLPFVGKSGQLLDRMIAAMGFDREEVYVCNVVKCRPPENRKPEPEEMAACMPYLSEQLACMAPRVIVALGATAVQGLLGTTEGIVRVRGKWQTLPDQTPVMPTFHPAYLLHNPSAKREVWADLQEVMRRLGRARAPAL